MINFVVSDLETALVPNGEKMVQEETIELIMELKEKGVYFAVATRSISYVWKSKGPHCVHM